MDVTEMGWTCEMSLEMIIWVLHGAPPMNVSSASGR